MIIHCSQCGTRYRFSEDKIKPGGTKVRCARCSNVFVVMPEEMISAFEPILEPQESVEESTAAEESVAAESSAGGSIFQGVPGGRNGSVAESSVKEGERAAETQPDSPAFLAPEDSELEIEESDLFEGIGATAEMEKELSAEADESLSEVAREAPVKPPSQFPDDDFFIQETPHDITSPESAKGGRSLVGRIFLLLFFLVVILCSGIGGYLFWRGEPFDIPHLMKIFQKSDSKAQKPAGKIHLKGVTSFYVFNQEAGQLFVISGTAVNEFSEARSGISVRGILYDGKGAELRQQTVFCGNPFEKEALNNMPYKTIEENMNNQFGTTFSNLNIAPGKEIPFSIIFRNLPENLAEFSVEVVASKTASEKK